MDSIVGVKELTKRNISVVAGNLTPAIWILTTCYTLFHPDSSQTVSLGY
jgi:uncharacterized membrane protein